MVRKTLFVTAVIAVMLLAFLTIRSRIDMIPPPPKESFYLTYKDYATLNKIDSMNTQQMLDYNAKILLKASKEGKTVKTICDSIELIIPSELLEYAKSGCIIMVNK